MRDQYHIKRRDAVKLIGAAGSLGLAGCSGGDSSGTPADNGSSDSVQAAFVFEQTDTSQWVAAHKNAADAVQEEFDWLEVDYSNQIAPSDAESTFSSYADQGYDMIVGCAFGYGDPLQSVSEEYPDTAFEWAGGTGTSDNLGYVGIRAHDGYYLAGKAAGMLTESDTLGFVVAFPVPKLFRRINAFTLGARSVNSSATTKVNWVSTWFDPGKESEAAQSLIDQGADVVTNWTNSVAVPERANETDTWVVGSATSQADIGGENYITSVMANWQDHHRPDVQDVRNDEWEPEFEWGGIPEGYVKLDDWGSNVPDDVIEEVESSRESLVSGDLDIWEGTQFADKDQDYMFAQVGDYVEGVEGEPPSS